jgi:hypothetical protein
MVKQDYEGKGSKKHYEGKGSKKHQRPTVSQRGAVQKG